MQNYKLPAGALIDKIEYFGPWHGGKPRIVVPFGEKPSRDMVKAVGDVLAQIVKDHSTITQDVKPIALTTPQTGRETLIESMEYEYGFDVKVSGEINPIIHLPAYLVYLAKGSKGFVQGAQAVVAILPKNKSCDHCVKSLEYITSLFKPDFSPTYEMLNKLPMP